MPCRTILARANSLPIAAPCRRRQLLIFWSLTRSDAISREYSCAWSGQLNHSIS